MHVVIPWLYSTEITPVILAVQLGIVGSAIQVQGQDVTPVAPGATPTILRVALYVLATRTYRPI